jgi:hypothetical protein
LWAALATALVGLGGAVLLTFAGGSGAPVELAHTEWRLEQISANNSVVVSTTDISRFGGGFVFFTFQDTQLTINWCSGREIKNWVTDGDILELTSVRPEDFVKTTGIGCALVQDPDPLLSSAIPSLLRSEVDTSAAPAKRTAQRSGDQLLISEQNAQTTTVMSLVLIAGR